MAYVASNELKHDGIKGMKWGVRRYQNTDGSLTDAGKKRYARDAREKGWKMGEDGIARSGGKKNRKEEDPDAKRWVKEDMERHKRVVESTSQLTSNLKNANKVAMDRANRKVVKMDLSNMTDKEMRDQINREILERQYNDMFAPRKVSKGREKVNQILEDVGPILGVTASALGIALSIRELTGGKAP